MQEIIIYPTEIALSILGETSVSNKFCTKAQIPYNYFCFSNQALQVECDTCGPHDHKCGSYGPRRTLSYHWLPLGWSTMTV